MPKFVPVVIVNKSMGKSFQSNKPTMGKQIEEGSINLFTMPMDEQ